MVEVKFEVTGFGPMDYVIFVPHAVVGDGDAGEVLSHELQEHLRWWAAIGFWPVDWMESNDAGWDGIWLKRELPENAEVARRQCEFFIRQRGYV